ncbi:MAG: DUF433 domain-containing protein [Chloroflexi bacterium]|nr:DUF433 domain-containing protein [Chloroflexota bacterium]
MKTLTPVQHIDFKANGNPILAGTRFSIAFLAVFVDDPDWPVERICETYGLTPGQVYAAWSFYYDHKEEIDRLLEEAPRPDEAAYRAKIKAMRARYAAKHGSSISEDWGPNVEIDLLDD